MFVSLSILLEYYIRRRNSYPSGLEFWDETFTAGEKLDLDEHVALNIPGKKSETDEEEIIKMQQVRHLEFISKFL